MSYGGRVLTTLAEDALVELAHLRVRGVTFAVAGEGQVGDHPVEGGEAVVEVRVHLSILLRQTLANLLALERAGSGQDGHLGEGLEDGECAPLVDVVHLVRTEGGVSVKIVLDLVLDHADV